jgi:hypothetical protein
VVTLTSSRLIPTRLLTPLVASFLLIISTFAQTSGSSSPQPVPSIKGNLLQVGIYRGKARAFRTIQDAVNVAKPGDWILIASGR